MRSIELLKSYFAAVNASAKGVKHGGDEQKKQKDTSDAAERLKNRMIKK